MHKLDTQDVARAIAELCNNIGAATDNSDIATAIVAAYLQQSADSEAVCDMVSDVDYYRDEIVRAGDTSSYKLSLAGDFDSGEVWLHDTDMGTLHGYYKVSESEGSCTIKIDGWC